jgi:hypothetical protein
VVNLIVKDLVSIQSALGRWMARLSWLGVFGCLRRGGNTNHFFGVYCVLLALMREVLVQRRIIEEITV